MIINQDSTTIYNYDEESEFVTSMISKTIPTPTSTLIDYELVKDLQIKMTDLQCKKYSFAGFKMRILGQICTAVQCIKDGLVLSN